MACCNHCRDAGLFFNNKTAKKELRKYKKKGADKSTQLLLNEIRKKDLKNKTLLDIGGGIGAISFELLQSGVDTSVHVDASPAYLNVTKNEAAKQGLAGRVTHFFGDFTELADDLKPADIVTLDRVICCYPDMEKLVNLSAKKSNLYYGVVYPKETWFIRLGMRLGNFYFKLRGNDFRTYLHPPGKIDETIQDNGFRRIAFEKTIIWEVALYTKEA